ncbi:DUF4224 domain-containing protein [Paraburkholderia tropica]|uniref:DUF4224 domain-containing protein n=1 Tax=Paraburkholderia tropica TaxID=92647 RepID=UPI001607422C|nr:DUF4224 domain-containing protein [Paraburkholderia tropica]
MGSSLFLTQDEMVELTGRRQRASQVQALRSMGIEHKVRADGRVLVLRKHVEEAFGAREHKASEPEAEPNWDAAN